MDSAALKHGSRFSVCQDAMDSASLLHGSSSLRPEQHHHTISLYGRLVRKCTANRALANGTLVHHCIAHNGLEHTDFLVNLLIQMYGTCSSPHDAAALFVNRCHEDNFAWNFMMRAYSESGQGEGAIFLFDHMQSEGFLPNEHIFSSALSACAMQRALTKGQEFHARIVGCGLDMNTVVGNNLVSFYGKCGRTEDALKIFYHLPERTIVSWTALIAAYAQSGINKDVSLLWDEMQQDAIKLDKVIFLSILSACSEKASLPEVNQIQDWISDCGFGSDVTVANALISLYGKCGSMKDAWRVFNGMGDRDVVSWSTMITVFIQFGRTKAAIQSFHQMKQEGFMPNKVTLITALATCADQDCLSEGKQLHAVISVRGLETDMAVGTALLNMYKDTGCLGGALGAFKNLILKDEAAYASVLSACATYGALTEGREAHAATVVSGAESEKNVKVALVTLYGKCGSLEEARKTFNLMSKGDVSVWNALITAHAQNGEGQDAVSLFWQMQSEEVWPDKATYKIVLSACSHCGLVDEACSCFLTINQNQGIKPHVDHYNCVADLLARAGRLDAAVDVINNMPFQPSVASWMILVSISRTQYNVERGDCTVKHVIELNPVHTAPYIILSNMYVYTPRLMDMPEELLSDLDSLLDEFLSRIYATSKTATAEVLPNDLLSMSQCQQLGAAR